MARNRIEELLVELKFKGGEELKKISGGFRELAKAANLADADIEDARAKIIDYGKTLGNTNQAVRGTIQALKALQESTQRGGEAWNKLSSDVLQFEQAARLTDREIELLRRGIVAEAGAHDQSATSIRSHVRALQELRAQSVLGGQVNRQLSQTIGQLTQQLEQAEQASRAHFSALNQMLAVRPDAVLRQYQAYTQVLRDVRATAEQAAEAQQRLNQLAGAPRIAARRELVARAGIQADPAYQERFGLGGRSLEALPDVPAALSLRLRELQEDLNFTTRNTQLYVSTLVEMASVQRQASATTQGFAAALREQLASGQLAPTQKNLQEVIGALRREMLELDTTTTEGGRAYAENARQADVLERQLKELASSYRNVADMATQAATAERSSAAARITALYMNNRAVRDQAQAMGDLGNAVRSGIAGTPLMLPAAGQTTAPGTGQAISGGARLLTGQTEATFGFPSMRSRLRNLNRPSAAVGLPAAVGVTSDAYAKQAREAFKASESLGSYFVAISKATQGSNNSINSLNQQRQAWDNLRNAIPRTYKLYSEATIEIQKLDRQLERSQVQRRRMGAMQATQAAGAVISGGIFGGPEGLIGGAIGTAVGGVPGAFAGAAIGAQVGMIRQNLGLVAQYVAQLNLAKTTLAQASTSQADYNNRLASARQISTDYAVALRDTLRGYAQVTVAARANGLSVKETEEVYRGVIAAGVAFGKSQGDLDAIITATVQVLSKGKVSAEELGGQIGERLPGAVAKFAAATGRTLPELAKALKDGEVGIADFVKFAQKQFTDYDSIAQAIGDSPEKAGARLQIALDSIAESYGGFLQNTGATFQNAATYVSTWVTSNESSIKRFLAALSLFGQDLAALLKPIAQTTVNILKPVFSFIFQNAARGIAAIRQSLKALQTVDYAGADKRAQRQVELLYPNPVERALKGAQAYREALGVELQAIDKSFGDNYSQRLDAEAARLFKMFQPSQFGTPGGGGGGVGTGDSTGDAKEKDRAADKARKDLFNELLAQLNAQNKVLSEQGKLNEIIAKTEMAKAVVAKSTAEEILDSEKKQLDLRLKFGEISRKVYDEQQKAIVLQGQVVAQEFTKTVEKLRKDAQQLVDEVFGAGGIAGPTTTPLQALIDQNNKEIEERRAKALQIGGTVGTEAAARLAGADIVQIASQKLVSGDITSLQQQIQELKDAGKELSTLDVLKRKYLEDWDSLDPILRGQLETMAAQVDALKKQQEAIEQLRNVAGSIGDAFGSAFKSVITGAATAKEALASFFSSVAEYFADMAAKMIAQWIKLAILNTIVRIFNPTAGAGLSDLSAPASINNPLGVLNANGNAFAQNGIVPYAKGGIVNSPTLFKFARGSAMATGVMGEAGPEAIMPLKRGADGKLGVAGGGGTGTTVNVSVDAKGTQVQGDSAQGAALGRVIAGAVQAELIKQQRPGGLLSGGR